MDPIRGFFLVFRSLGNSATSVTITMKPGSADPHADVPFSSSKAVNRSNHAPLADRLNLVIAAPWRGTALSAKSEGFRDPPATLRVAMRAGLSL
jgi:hypothetical protein